LKTVGAHTTKEEEVIAMMRWFVGVLIVAHGLVTAAIWSAPAKADAPFQATHSWLLGDARRLATAIAIAAATGFVLAGVGVAGHHTWWAGFAIAAGALAVLLMVVYFNPWLIAGIAISTAIVVAGVQTLQEA
jgi:hypothetical protein